MNRMLPLLLTVAASGALGAVSAGCETYDAPPEIKLRLPEDGVYTSGDALVLEFSEPIDPATLAIRIWPKTVDLDNELLPGTVPHLNRCTTDTSPCETTALSLADDRLSATLQFDETDLGKPDVPLLVEVLPGLSDADGHDRSARSFFDVQFAPKTSAGGANFVNGTYLIVGQTTQPLPATLRLVTEFRTLEDGRVAITGAQGSTVGDAPKNTKNIDEIVINTTQDGFTIHGLGTLSTDAEGDRFLKTDPFEVHISIGPIVVELHEVILQGEVIKDEGDNDFIDGTLRFSGVTLITGDSFEYEGGSAPVEGIFVPADKVPPGGPAVCGDLCGDVPQCEPPADFPGEGFCEK